MSSWLALIWELAVLMITVATIPRCIYCDFQKFLLMLLRTLMVLKRPSVKLPVSIWYSDSFALITLFLIRVIFKKGKNCYWSLFRHMVHSVHVFIHIVWNWNRVFKSQTSTCHYSDYGSWVCGASVKRELLPAQIAILRYLLSYSHPHPALS